MNPETKKDEGNGARPGFLARMKAHIVHPELSARQVALSFGIGFSICWNPFLGTHTWLVLGLCFAFKRLHRPLVLATAFLNNPWTMVPIATFSAYFGNILLGRGLDLDFSGIHWNSIGIRSFLTREGFQAMSDMLRPILTPYLLGGIVLSALAVPAGYLLMLWITRRLRGKHARTFQDEEI